ncbi:MAG: adenylyl-sulfate kinase [Methanobrevibacter sp.]|nr:adenylyl-sulfate kinase [Methanobrevibacter sp.]
MRTIMISGKSASGKDEFARFLKEKLEKHGKTVLIIHFGDAVKDMLTRYYGWDGNKDTAGRAMLQHLGTEVMRATYPTYWAELVAKFISATSNDWHYVLIPDLRFYNEFETICQYNKNVTTIRINRFDNEGKPYYNSNMRMNQLTHVSECELDNFNFEYIVENRSDVAALKESADLLIEELEKE